jgi:hypothetical protein
VKHSGFPIVGLVLIGCGGATPPQLSGSAIARTDVHRQHLIGGAAALYRFVIAVQQRMGRR